MVIVWLQNDAKLQSLVTLSKPEISLSCTVPQASYAIQVIGSLALFRDPDSPVPFFSCLERFF
jgi:hypothetical protein